MSDTGSFLTHNSEVPYPLRLQPGSPMRGCACAPACAGSRVPACGGGRGDSEGPSRRDWLAHLLARARESGQAMADCVPRGQAGTVTGWQDRRWAMHGPARGDRGDTWPDMGAARVCFVLLFSCCYSWPRQAITATTATVTIPKALERCHHDTSRPSKSGARDPPSA